MMKGIQKACVLLLLALLISGCAKRSQSAAADGGPETPAPDADPAAALREKFPEYFGLDTFKGLEVYVWQMAEDSYSFGVLPGTNRIKTLEERMRLKGASAGEMRAILSSYVIEKEMIVVIPWQNPISSYIGEYWIRQRNEDPESAAKRREEYVEKLRDMLFGDRETLRK